LATRNMTQASRPLRAELPTASARPQPIFSSGCGFRMRWVAAQMMATAAPMISAPSKPDEKYSALWWP
jgi:hypothetical protein